MPVRAGITGARGLEGLPSPRRVRPQVLAMLALIGGSPERY
jgi:hypothetical protein